MNAHAFRRQDVKRMSKFSFSRCTFTISQKGTPREQTWNFQSINKVHCAFACLHVYKAPKTTRSNKQTRSNVLINCLHWNDEALTSEADIYDFLSQEMKIRSEADFNRRHVSDEKTLRYGAASETHLVSWKRALTLDEGERENGCKASKQARRPAALMWELWRCEQRPEQKPTEREAPVQNNYFSFTLPMHARTRFPSHPRPPFLLRVPRQRCDLKKTLTPCDFHKKCLIALDSLVNNYHRLSSLLSFAVMSISNMFDDKSLDAC